jgi:hypothetical protein
VKEEALLGGWRPTIKEKRARKQEHTSTLRVAECARLAAFLEPLIFSRTYLLVYLVRITHQEASMDREISHQVRSFTAPTQQDEAGCEKMAEHGLREPVVYVG